VIWSGDNRYIEVGEVRGVEIGLKKQGERQRERGLKEVGAHRNCEQRQTGIGRNDAVPRRVGGLLQVILAGFLLKEFRFVR
jgi:hypothetical protein